MGALHEGHAALIRAASERAAKAGDAAGAVVSLFVNPTQFNERSDFERYPRTQEADLALCKASGASAVFVPEVETVYPSGHPPPIPPLPRVATEPALEDAFRPGHFAGVCQVVLRLFDLLGPREAVFGEKDWQQLQVIRALAAAERPDISIVPAPTVRERDGLALSSRNRFLRPDDRARALAIPVALVAAGAATSPQVAEEALLAILDAVGLTPEYAAVRHPETLRPLDPSARTGRALVAVRVGAVRLIDNSPWTAPR
jgi:pantoate--beta-alanine ligase